MSDSHSEQSAPKPKPKHVPVVTDISPFAMTNFRNEKKVFGIRSDDRRRHVYVIGKTGMGKSTLLENLVYSDIQKGNGVCYVDPHGDTAEKILQWIPKHRIKDTIYFCPSDYENPIAFNVLEKVAPEYRNLVASGLVSVYKKLWADSWGPRLEYILRYCILALLDTPDATLLGINRMLVDKKYREAVMTRVTDPVVRSFWEDEFSKWNDRVLAEVISPIQNKVGQFLSNSMIRNIVGQRESSMSLREIMDNKKILILNLSKGRMGEDASALLGAMMITKIQLAAMSRVDIPEDEREDFYLYVDEFQNFATESFANILSEARKYRLCLTMAHQYIAQLEQGSNTVVRDAVFGNVGTLIVFRVGAADAEFLEKEFAPQFMLEDLVNLPKYRIYLKLMVNGVSTDPFSADALGPLAGQDFGHGAEVIAHTHQQYSRNRLDVEESIKQWHASEGGDMGTEKPETEFHTGVSPIKAFEEAQNKEKIQTTSKPVSAEAIKPKAKVETSASRPAPSKEVLWTGVCDVCSTELKLSFMPDVSRPILCQDDLKKFRKGGLTTPQVEAMMIKVMDRKASKPNDKIQMTNDKQVSKPSSPQRPGIVQPAKGNIRIVSSFDDEEKRTKDKELRTKEQEPITKNQEPRKGGDSRRPGQDRRPEDRSGGGNTEKKSLDNLQKPNPQSLISKHQSPTPPSSISNSPSPTINNQPTPTNDSLQTTNSQTKHLNPGQKIEF